MQRFILLILLSLFLYNCRDNEAQLNVDYLSSKDTIYSEQFRPQFHFTPQAKWMNDPNGLVYNNDTYHLYYQYYPDSTVWGPMHWGHAESKDLLHWTHKPIALAPDSLGYIFSGSAVVDRNNTSGFGKDYKPPMVAIFTYHSMEGEKAGRSDFQTQGIAYSNDDGLTWKKYKGNPVIKNDSIRDFRDPKVFWHDASNKWILILVAGDHALFYNSDNLKDWSLVGDFGKQFGAHGGVWECPDLFKLNIDNTDEEKWVLLISINPGGPNGGSATQYFIGNFDGKTFTPDHLDVRWLDYGMDNYAGVTYNHTPKNERILIGWMSNWNYAQETPTEEWRSAMTLPRKLTLYKDGEEVRLRNYPINEFDNLVAEEVDFSTDLETTILLKTNPRLGSDITFRANLTKPLTVKLSNRSREDFVFAANPKTQLLTVDRANSGVVDFGKEFATKKQSQPYLPQDKMVEVRMIVDASSVEIFVEKGKYVFTNQVFPAETYSRLLISPADDESVENIEINLIKSVWIDEE
ncbi:fructan beta-fructosidase [Flavobacteriaceae bacterium MAR_2010_188]|nr:fructan beta-fructosidase [Flavobacteriaceae bacterium MAR_2010_188]